MDSNRASIKKNDSVICFCALYIGYSLFYRTEEKN